jgi:hypothetical protein
MSGKFAGGEAQSRNRSAEAGVACALEVEARLERQATQGGANRPASDLQRVGRQLRVTHRPRPLELDGTGDRAVGINAALPARAFETGVVEHLANDKLTGLVGGHLAGYRRRQHGHHANRQYNTIQRNISRTPTDAKPYYCSFSPVLDRTDYARLSSTNLERAYPIFTTTLHIRDRCRKDTLAIAWLFR